MDPLTDAPPDSARTAAWHVTALYEAHATGLVRLAMLMLRDQPSAEDVVQDAFLGVYRRWDALTDQGRALAYVRSSVLNGCRTVLRRRAQRGQVSFIAPDAESAEARMLLGEEHREVLAALRRLPDRKREAVVLRYCLDLPEEEVARVMNVSRGTVKSAASRGLAALARMLREQS